MFCTFLVLFLLLLLYDAHAMTENIRCGFSRNKIVSFYIYILFAPYSWPHFSTHLSHTLHLVCCWLLIYTLVYISKVVMIAIIRWLCFDVNVSNTLIEPSLIVYTVVRLYRLVEMYRLHEIFTLFGQQSTFSLSLLSQMYCKRRQPELKISTDDCRVCVCVCECRNGVSSLFVF